MSHKIYDMRWRYDFKDGRIRYGKWSRPSNTPELQAWRNNDEGLVRASIEGKDMFTGEIKPLAECDGHDFVNFQWIATASGNVMKSNSLVHRLMGMKLLTRDYEHCVFPDGSGAVIPRSEADKKINFATFGK
jgi:hypothetical protein